MSNVVVSTLRRNNRNMTEQETIQDLKAQVEALKELAKSLYYNSCTMHLMGKCRGADGEHQHKNCVHTKGGMHCSFHSASDWLTTELSAKFDELVGKPQPNPESVYPKGRYHGD